MRLGSWIVISSALLFTTPIFAQPSNDNCASPQAQSDIITFVSTNVGATTDGTASCGGTADIWFNYVASATGTVAVDTCGSDFDTTLAAYESCAGAELACDDDSGCGNTSLIQFAVISGQGYRLRVAGKNGATGNVVITASVVATGGSRPANDSCENAEVVSNGATNGTNVASTTDGTASCVTSVASGKDVWYKYTAPADGSVTIDTLATEQLPSNSQITDSVLSVLNACAGSEIACNDDANSGTLFSSVTFNVTSGTTYYIRVAGSLGQAGAFTLTIDGPTGPNNNGNSNGDDNSNDNSGGNDNGTNENGGSNQNTNNGDNTNSGSNSNTNSGDGGDNNNGGVDGNQNSGDGGGDGNGDGSDNSGDGTNTDDPNAAANQCAAGICGGTNALSMIPLTLLGIACMKAGGRPMRRTHRRSR